MIGYLRGKAVSQVDAVFFEGKMFTDKQIREVLKDVEPYSVKKKKK